MLWAVRTTGGTFLTRTEIAPKMGDKWLNRTVIESLAISEDIPAYVVGVETVEVVDMGK